MVDKILNLTILLGIISCVITILFLIHYMVTRKSIYDKVIASDLIAMPLIMLIVLVSMYYKTVAYISLILIICIICFIGTVVTTRFLARKEIFPNDNSK